MSISEAPPNTEVPANVSMSAKRPGLNTETVAMGGLFVAVFAFLAAIFAVVLAATAVDEARDSSGSASSGGSAAVATVGLSEFALSPANSEVAAGGSIEVRNDGVMIHNLSVDGVATPMLDGGKSTELDISALKPGVYTMKCDVPGHADAGMKGSLTIK